MQYMMQKGGMAHLFQGCITISVPELLGMNPTIQWIYSRPEKNKVPVTSATLLSIEIDLVGPEICLPQEKLSHMRR